MSQPDLVPIRVLFIHHVPLMGGSSRSLYELMRAFPKNALKLHVIAPSGHFSKMAEALGAQHISCLGVPKFDNCAYSYYRKFRWLILLRELAFVIPFLFSCLKARRKLGIFDIVHVNDIPLLPAAWIAKKIFPRSKIVLHARAVQWTAPKLRTQVFNKLVSKTADQVIAIDKTVRRSLPENLPVSIVHNGLKVPSNAQEKDKVENVMTLGMVGMIAKSKGCDTFIEAARICRDWNLNTRFILVGESSSKKNWKSKLLQLFGLKHDMGQELKEAVKRLSLEKIVQFFPFNPDLEQIYSQIDVLCFPSLLDAPGRPIFEAAFFSKPSIAAISHPEPDTFIDGITGFTVPANNPSELAQKIKLFAEKPELRIQFGKSARALADENFNAEKNAARVLEIYKNLIAIHKSNS